jgi:hypothetical protein
MRETRADDDEQEYATPAANSALNQFTFNHSAAGAVRANARNVTAAHTCICVDANGRDSFAHRAGLSVCLSCTLMVFLGVCPFLLSFSVAY